jgi:hypothetical protein
VVRVAAYLLEHIASEKVLADAYDTLAIYEELLSLAWAYWEDIIVELEVLLVKTFDAVKVHLYRVAIECRQTLLWDNILV